MGRRSVSRQHDGVVMEDDVYKYVYLCTDIAHKRIVPMVIDVKAKFPPARGRSGPMWEKNFSMFSMGQSRSMRRFYEEISLDAGDSVYFDSTMGHAYIAAKGKPAQLLVMCSSATPNLAQTLRELLKQRLTAKSA